MYISIYLYLSTYLSIYLSIYIYIYSARPSSVKHLCNSTQLQFSFAYYFLLMRCSISFFLVSSLLWGFLRIFHFESPSVFLEITVVGSLITPCLLQHSSLYPLVPFFFYILNVSLERCIFNFHTCVCNIIWVGFLNLFLDLIF